MEKFSVQKNPRHCKTEITSFVRQVIMPDKSDYLEYVLANYLSLFLKIYTRLLKFPLLCFLSHKIIIITTHILN